MLRYLPACLLLYSYTWLPGKEKPMPIAGMDHICIDWDNMMKWAAGRSFSLDDKLLTHPDSSKYSIISK